MSPKLLLTYPHREEDPGIAMAQLFTRQFLCLFPQISCYCVRTTESLSYITLNTTPISKFSCSTPYKTVTLILACRFLGIVCTQYTKCSGLRLKKDPSGWLSIFEQIFPFHTFHFLSSIFLQFSIMKHLGLINIGFSRRFIFNLATLLHFFS